MTQDLSRKLRRARRSEIVPVYFGIKRALEKAMSLQPYTLTLVSVEEGVWEILADAIRVGGVIAPAHAVRPAARLFASKIRCNCIEDDLYFSKAKFEAKLFQIQLT